MQNTLEKNLMNSSIIPKFAKLVVFAAVCFSAFSQTTPPTAQPITVADIDQCKNIVQEYCSAWKTGDYDTMFTLLNAEGMAIMGKDKFIEGLRENAQAGIMLISFNITEAKSNENEVLVKATLGFAKQKKPSMMNGIYSFYLSRDGNLWKIKTILAPVIAPTGEGMPGGSHPGE
jgi:hypothetical protein